VETRTSGLTCITAPLSPAVSIQRARENSRVDGSDHDNTLKDNIEAATVWIQDQTDTALITSTWRWTLDRFPVRSKLLRLPRWPVQSIESIQYTDANGDTQTIAAEDIVLRLNNGRARIALKQWKAWPATQLTPDAVRINFVAGFGDSPNSVPAAWQLPILLLVGHWFENREAVVIGTISSDLPMGVQAMVDTLRDPDDDEESDDY
jgi:uncharacterized phiE125 gp8 family phage protein